MSPGSSTESYPAFARIGLREKRQPVKEYSTGHVARMGEFRNAYRVLVGRQEGKRDLWGDQDVDGRKKLKWI
ncbi:hypothetical protein ANN_12351 [Periplaneta americana]|uniref:Uncharacterized protein n=1 Tax=Periplaneta americana TaxID=6978 RepID=A0ABQ8TIS8_PERAM|nr:hypothetical protein ANN_12351 [Periplaneta americana]